MQNKSRLAHPAAPLLIQSGKTTARFLPGAPSGTTLYNNVKKLDLVSKEWCDLIFQGKNKEYGAYMMRQRSARRHRFALLCIIGFFLFCLLSAFLLRFYIAYEIKQGLKGLERFGQVDMPPLKEGHELKAVATGRHAVTHKVVQSPHATKLAPEIVDFAPNPFLLGEKGLEDLRASEEMELITLKDTTGLEDDPDAPEIGAQLTPTEVVEQMPQFPGGPAALMKWLDAHIPYPTDCIKSGIEGSLEITFLVAPDGSIREPAVSKKLHPKLDAVALSAIRRMPKWHPGKMNGKPVLVRVTVPVIFAVK